MSARDWTVDPATGRSNSSADFEKMAAAVKAIIIGSAHDLIDGNAYGVARIIVAQLAHKHGMAPPPRRRKP